LRHSGQSSTVHKMRSSLSFESLDYLSLDGQYVAKTRLVTKSIEPSSTRSSIHTTVTSRASTSLTHRTESTAVHMWYRSHGSATRQRHDQSSRGSDGFCGDGSGLVTASVSSITLTSKQCSTQHSNPTILINKPPERFHIPVSRLGQRS
jgi:hypothetical protein